MILLLRDLEGGEHRVGVDAGRFVVPESIPGEAQDLRRYWAMGGLADCHAHLSGDDVDDMIACDGTDIVPKMRRNALAQLKGGVLLIADKGAKTSLALRLVDEDEASRPIVQMAGRMITVPEGYYPGFATEIEPANLTEVVSAATTDGATWVKLVGDWPRRGRGSVSNFNENELREIVAIAHAAGCRVAIHTTAPETPGVAVRAGVDSIEHGLFLQEEDIVALGARGGAWVPTVLAMESTAAFLGPDSTGGRMFAAGLGNVRGQLAPAVAAGVAVLAGTDLAIPHGAVAAEAARLTEYGLTNEQALHAVSRAAYDYLGIEGGFAPGQSADLVLFAENPLHDLTELQRPAHVMRAGRVVIGSLG